MRLFETSENQVTDSPTPRNNEASNALLQDIQPCEGAHNRESSRKGMYLRYTSSNRPTATVERLIVAVNEQRKGIFLRRECHHTQRTGYE